MSDQPKSAADPRPNNEPYYIDSACDCGGELVPEPVAYATGWFDEFECMNCQGLHLDVPDSYIEGLESRMVDENFAHPEEVSKAFEP